VIYGKGSVASIDTTKDKNCEIYPLQTPNPNSIFLIAVGYKAVSVICHMASYLEPVYQNRILMDLRAGFFHRTTL
jgi:hypothetical protein